MLWLLGGGTAGRNGLLLALFGWDTHRLTADSGGVMLAEGRWLLVVAMVLPPVLCCVLVALTRAACSDNMSDSGDGSSLRPPAQPSQPRRWVGLLAVAIFLWMAAWSMMLWLLALLPLAIAALASFGRLRLILSGSYGPRSRDLMVRNAIAWSLLVNACWAIGLALSGAWSALL